MKLQKIYLISDVHIRNLKRHKEYEEVFARLFQYITDTCNENSAIVLGGDIVHSKTDISPELVDITARFLKRCADTLPTILIAGNHDFSPSNSRLDSLSPIVNSLNHPNLHYWKDSGVYELGGVSFSVFSLFGEPEDWTMADKMEGSTKIAIHHGPVKKHNEPDKQYGLDLKYFDGFDIGLLGDLHTHHFVDEHYRVGYPGSLICQNYSEEPNGHGIMVWDIATRTSSFVEIPNDYAYVTFDLVDGQCEDTTDLPPNLRARIRHENSTVEQVESFIKSIGKKYKLIEVVKQKSSSTGNKQDSARPEFLADSRNLDVQNALITEHLKISHPEATVEEIAAVCKLNAEINRQLSATNARRGVVWKPISLKFENMFSYGPDNCIDFGKLGGVYGISEKNTAGKSSIFDILCFVLYDKTTRANKAAHILNNSSDGFKCSLEFELDGERYTIDRTGTKQKGGNVKVDVNFWRTGSDGVAVNLNGEDRNKTNFVIRDVVGNYDDFVMTSLSTQYDNQNFIEKTQSDRKDLLYKFLDINVYDELLKIAKDESKAKLTLLKEFEREDLYAKSSGLNETIKQSQASIDGVVGLLELNRNELATLNEAVNNLNRKLQTVDIADKLPDIEAAIQRESSEIQRYLAEYKLVSEEIEQKRIQLSELKLKLQGSIDECGELNCEELKLQHSSVNSRQLQLDSQIKSLNRELEHCKSQSDSLKNHKYDPNCEFCIDNKFVKDATLNIEKIPTLQHSIEITKSELANVELELSKLQSTLTTANVQQKLREDGNRCEGEIVMLTSKQELIAQKGKNCRTNLLGWEERKKLYEMSQSIIEQNARIESEILAVNSSKRMCEVTISTLESQHRKLTVELEMGKSQSIEIQDKLDKYLTFKNEYRVHELYLNAVGKDGVPYRIVEKVLPVIEDEVNRVLESLVPFTVKIEAADDKYVQAEIVYGDSHSWPVELSSGMERFILSLAFRSALSEITNLPKTNFLAIDEGFGVLDSENLQGVEGLFAYLRKQYDFLLCVSHIEAMRDMVDKQIKIEKMGGFSKINV